MGIEAVTDLTVDNGVLGIVQSRAIPCLDGGNGSIRIEVRHIVELAELMWM